MSHNRDVFINCPLDRKYRPLLRALLFGVHDCGFRARSALEVEDSGEVRVAKILRIIGESPLGIHDISRVEPDPDTNLPRFNMPLELGLFLGAKAFGATDQQTKRCIVLDKEPFRYQKFCSDIAGQDIQAHDGRTHRAIEIVRNWLSTSPAAQGTVIPSGSVIAARYEAFRKALPDGCVQLQLNPRRLTFGDNVLLVVAWLKENPWDPSSGLLRSSLKQRWSS
jgi:hypothetical protein